MESTPRVLLVEDDRLVREGAVTTLEAEGFDVVAEPDGVHLDQVLERFEPHLALLDINLPKGPDGFAIAKYLHAGQAIPVIFITARDAIEDRLKGFDLGADDYLVKPFSLHEMTARVKAVLRRTGAIQSSVIEVGDVVVDTRSRTVERAGEVVNLTPTEFDLLATLCRTPGRPRTKLELLEEVWGFTENAPHLVEVQISGLRRKLEALGPRMVLTCRNGSYVVER